tara:strand:- start:837 stop:2234 length:1398 start_codon:yes stop_codon:yes gene_type:complete
MKLREAPLNPSIAITGRVESWIENPTRRYPVSCTVFVCQDTMDEHKDGLEGSFLFASKALRYGAGVSIHLSNLRPKGTKNEHGMVASGPCGFMEIYSKFNEILRRGGTYRNGAIVNHCDYDHPDIIEFINYDRSRIPWVKRCVNVDENVINKPDVLHAIMEGARKGDIWIVKKQYDSNGERIYHNVCQEILLKSRDTCLLSHVNLGMTRINEIVDAFADGMKFLCELHKKTGVDESDIYEKRDNQVGLGVLGLSNLLAIEGVTYAEFVDSLRRWNLGVKRYESTADAIVGAIGIGFLKAAEVARSYGMSRAFTVAPTASCAYRYVDREGHTTSPEIAPPISREVDRDSSTLGVHNYKFHPKCETSQEVGWDTFFELNAEWQVMMDKTRLGHAISMNWWSDMTTFDRQFMSRWLNSPLKSLYYSLQVMPDTQDKTDAYAALSDVDVDEYLNEILAETPEPNCDCAE